MCGIIVRFDDETYGRQHYFISAWDFFVYFASEGLWYALHFPFTHTHLMHIMSEALYPSLSEI